MSLEELKKKYESALKLAKEKGVQVKEPVTLKDKRLYIQGVAPSERAKNDVWNQIKAIDAKYPDLDCDLTVDPSIAPAVARLDALTEKYRSVLDLAERRGVKLLKPLQLVTDRLSIRGFAPSEQVEKEVWDPIKASSDVTCDLTIDPLVLNGTPIDFTHLIWMPRDEKGNSLGEGQAVPFNSLDTVILPISKLPAEKLQKLEAGTIQIKLLAPPYAIELGEFDLRLPTRQLVVTLEQLKLEKLGVAFHFGVSLMEWNNATDVHVDFYVVEPNGNVVFRGMGQPGSVRDYFELRTYIAKATFTGELLAIFVPNPTTKTECDVKQQPYPLTITSEYSRRKQQQKQKWLPSPVPDIQKNLYLVGQQTADGGQFAKVDPGSLSYVVESTFDDPPKKQFNTYLNVKTKSKKISAVELSSDAPPLDEYQSGGIKDLASLEIYADRVVISSALKLPGTDVTIYARKLEFEAGGQIDTTPLKFESASSTPAEKRDSEGRPKNYIAAEGLNGEKAGDINLFVKELKVPEGSPNTKRFIAMGSKGQDGEAGGLKDYKQGNSNQPEDEGARNVSPVTEQMMKDAFPNWFTADGKYLNYWHWPKGDGGECWWPHDIRYDGKQLFPENGQGNVTYLKIVACHDPVDTNFLFFPAKVRHHSGGIFAGGLGVPDPSECGGKIPGNGRDAYAGGKPGKGGKGGTIRTSLPADVVKPLSNVTGGEGGITDAVKGGPRGTPIPAYGVEMLIVRYGSLGVRKPQIQVPPAHDVRDGFSAPEQKGEEFGDGEVMQVTASWMREEIVDAVIACAKDAYRNEDRELARRLLEPYYSLLRGSTDSEMKTRFAAIEAIRGKLLANVDYNGNPPGWVPRLNLQSTFDQFKEVRPISQALRTYAAKMRDRYETLDHARTVITNTYNEIGKELNKTRTLLSDSVTELANARSALDDISEKAKEKQADIDRLRTWAMHEAEDRVAAQRIFRGVMKTIGGLMKAVPVGQPYLGLAGDITSGIGDFNWNDPKGIGVQIGDTLGRIGSATDTFLEKNKDLIKKDSVPDDLRKRLKLDQQTTLNLQADLDVAKDAIAKQELAIEAEQEKKIKAWAEDENVKAELTRLGQELKTKTDEIERGQAFTQLSAAEQEEAKKKLAALKKWSESRDARTLIKRRKELEADIAAIEKQQNDAKTDAEKKAAQPLIDLKSKLILLKTAASDQELAMKKAARDTALTSEQIKNKEEGTGDALDRLKGLGSGISTLGQGLASLFTPVTTDDPEVTSLTAHLLKTDENKRKECEALLKDFSELSKKQKQALATLMVKQASIDSCVANISQNLTELSALSWQRQSIQGVLDVRVLRYLKDMENRAIDALRWSIYVLVMAYRYEYLTDVGGDFLNFDKVVERLRKLANLDDKEGKDDNTAEVVLKKEFLAMAMPILEGRNKRAGEHDSEWRLTLNEKQRSELRLRGRVTFNIVNDLKTGSFEDTKARILDIDHLDLELKSGQLLNLKATFWHSGKSIILDEKESRYYFFQAAPEDRPIFWSFNYTRDKEGKQKPIKDVKASDNDAFLKTLFAEARKKAPEDMVNYKEYFPSFFSDITFELTHGSKPWNAAEVAAIEKVEFTAYVRYASPGRPS